jgi:hypothetical protein
MNRSLRQPDLDDRGKIMGETLSRSQRQYAQVPVKTFVN